MRDYGKVSTSIWNSRKFGKVSDDARLLYLYLHTCPHVNSVGCFVLKDGYATADLGWTVERYLEALDRLSKAFLVGFDRAENLVRVVNFLKFDPFTNPKHAQGAVKLALALPDSQEKINVLKDISQCRHAENLGILHRELDRLSIGYRNPEPEPEPEPEFPSVTSEQNFEMENEAPAPPAKPKSERQEVIDTLAGWASLSAITSFLAYRGKIKKPVTLTAANRMGTQLEAILAGGGDPSDALGMCEERGWQGVKAEWYFNSKGQDHGQPNNNGQQSGYSSRAQGYPNGASGAHAGLIAGLAENADRYSRGEGSDDSDDAIPI